MINCWTYSYSASFSRIAAGILIVLSLLFTACSDSDSLASATENATPSSTQPSLTEEEAQPSPVNLLDNTPQSASKDVGFSLSKDRIELGEVSDLVVTANPRDQVLGAVTFSIVYDPDIVSVESCSVEGILGVCNPEQAGILRVAAINPEQIEGNLELLVLNLYGKNEGFVGIEISEIEVLSNINGEPLTYDQTFEAALIVQQN